MYSREKGREKTRTLVERIKMGHLVGRNFEVEYVTVCNDALLGRRLGDGDIILRRAMD
jgi:hypothetical protein